MKEQELRRERKREREGKGGKWVFRNSRVHLQERRLKPQVYIQEKTIKNHKVLISVNTRRLGRRNRARSLQTEKLVQSFSKAERLLASLDLRKKRTGDKRNLWEKSVMTKMEIVCTYPSLLPQKTIFCFIMAELGSILTQSCCCTDASTQLHVHSQHSNLVETLRMHHRRISCGGKKNF